jgi:hypothetical protein
LYIVPALRAGGCLPDQAVRILDFVCFLMAWVSRKIALHPSPKLAMDEGQK